MSVQDTTTSELLLRVFHSGAPVWERLALTNPEFVQAYASYTESSTTRNALPADKRALLQLAVESSVTSLDAAACEDRMRAALGAGATPKEILHILMLVSFCSFHTLSSGLPAVLEGLDPSLITGLGPEREQRGQALRKQYLDGHAYWAAFDASFPRFHEHLSTLTPDLFESYQRLGRSMWTEGGLSPKWCELAFVAMDLSTTHLYLDGARLHAANAVHYGATIDEVVATVAIAAAQGAKTIEVGLPILWRLLAEATP